MKSTLLFDYAKKRLHSALYPEYFCDSICKLLAVFDRFNVTSKEMWFEVHYNKCIDFIMEVEDILSLKPLCDYLASTLPTEAAEAWTYIREKIKDIETKPNLFPKYMHVVSLEFDMEEIMSERYCPCIFFEFDVEQMRIDHTDRYNIYRLFDNAILPEYCRFAGEVTNNKTVENLLSDGFELWNIGFMMSRKEYPRVFSVPLDYEKANYFLLNLHADQLVSEIESGSHDKKDYLIDFDIEGSECNNIGVIIYAKFFKERMGYISSLVENRVITAEEASAIEDWNHKEFVVIEDKKKLVVYQVSHNKLKNGKNNAKPKIYLRIKEWE